jgi:hypothetical protein
MASTGHDPIKVLSWNLPKWSEQHQRKESQDSDVPVRILRTSQIQVLVLLLHQSA